MWAPLQLVAALCQPFDRLGIPYLIGGSLASSLYGTPRATRDADIVVDLHATHVSTVVAAWEPSCYVAEEAVREALARRTSFNVIHLASMFKADFFPLPALAWEHERMGRRRVEQVPVGEEVLTLPFSSPEDTVLHKLTWYRMSGERSDRQWGDVIGVLAVQGALLDVDYMHRWARDLGVDDLLTRAESEARGG